MNHTSTLSPDARVLDLGAVLVEVDVVLAAVGLAALPGLEVLVVRTAAVDAVVELLVAHRLAGGDGDFLVPAARVGLVKASGVKSGASMPVTETGWSGWSAVSATASANGTFFANSCWISFSSSGKVKTEAQSSGFQASFGSMSEAVWQVDISGVNIEMPLTLPAWPSASPLVV